MNSIQYIESICEKKTNFDHELNKKRSETKRNEMKLTLSRTKTEKTHKKAALVN